MERVHTLCQKLQQQLVSGARPEELLITVQLLQSELQHICSAPAYSGRAVALDIPVAPTANPNDSTFEKILEVLKIDESEVEAELEQLRENMKSREKISAQNKPPMQFDPLEETPTLARTPVPEKPVELHEKLSGINPTSLHDKLRVQIPSAPEGIPQPAISDLRKGIGVNERFLLINDLFRGDEDAYERSVKTINSFASLAEANDWIRRELKLKLGWDENHPSVMEFDQLVRRRFSRI